jgi:peptidoglycan/LPS O-acetylase OafA/YrhL
VTGREPDRLSYIDALRGWAILLVLLTHAAQGRMAAEALSQAAPQSPVLDLPSWLQRICAHAGSGVHLFFVVSALSLALSARKRQEHGLGAYVIRRFCRIAPMFYAGIVLYLALFGWGPRLYAPDGIGPGDVALTFGLLHIWSTNALNSVVPGDWSVGVEVMFYLILPLLLLIGRTPTRLAALTLGFVLMAQAVHWSGTGFGPFGNPGFPSQSVVFLFGLIAAGTADSQRFGLNPSPALRENVESVSEPNEGPARQRRNEDSSERASGSTLTLPLRGSLPLPQCGRGAMTGGASLAVFLFLVVGLPLWHLPETILVYHVQFAALAGLLCILLHRAPTPILVNRTLAGIGRISFSMYILQFALFTPAFGLAKQLAGRAASGGETLAIYYPLLVTATAACAAVTYASIEQPGMRLGRFLILRQQRGGAVERPI